MQGTAVSTTEAGNSQDSGRRIYVDALQCSNWDRALLEQWQAGGLGCVHVTTSIWDGARETLRTIARWKRRFRDDSDIIAQARTVDDIHTIAASGRTAVILGFQNTSPFEDDLGMVEIFHDLGVRVAQLTYNIANYVGSSCYEPVDGGLTRFGKNVIREMNRIGMIVDLSHTGPITSMQAITASERPVMASHANAAAVWRHPRNLSDELLRALADRGGIIGCAPYPHLTGGDEVTGRQWAEGVAHCVEVMGIDHVAIGTDSSHHFSDDDLRFIREGYWTHEPNFGAGSPDKPGWLPWPAFFRTPADFANFDTVLSEVGFDDAERAKIMGGNLMRFYGEGFNPQLP
jgi:microsomal dipeptidase-like Zn-dependent dipeptidase